ncbi:MAG: acyl-CoA desaturase [Phycisphaerae bacterium]|nr:acyl-CoA desaturase [Phycisphaerae bacterium]
MRMRASIHSIIGWVDSRELNAAVHDPRRQVTDPVRWIPYVALHAGCLGVLWVGWSWTALSVAIALYLLRMFAITGFYHRYFSHRAFATSRWAQFVFAVWGNAAAQRGPIWWASHHRQHHQHSDREEDAHSPAQHGFWWSHLGWLTARDNLAINSRYVRDLLRYPELRFLDRFDFLVPSALAVALFLAGTVLHRVVPHLGTDGPQMLVWGFFVSTVVLLHGTCTINSLAHLFGSRRYETKDDSRNNFLLALLTLGEGWHNNHHRCPWAAQQGFYWWEIDITYYGLRLLETLGLIWNLKRVSAGVRSVTMRASCESRSG